MGKPSSQKVDRRRSRRGSQNMYTRGRIALSSNDQHTRLELRHPTSDTPTPFDDSQTWFPGVSTPVIWFLGSIPIKIKIKNKNKTRRKRLGAGAHVVVIDQEAQLTGFRFIYLGSPHCHPSDNLRPDNRAVALTSSLKAAGKNLVVFFHNECNISEC